MNKIIEKFSASLETLIIENESLKKRELLYKKQLFVILMSNAGKLQNINYEDLFDVDFDKMSINIGMTSCSVSIIGGNYISSWDQVPRKSDNTDGAE